MPLGLALALVFPPETPAEASKGPTLTEIPEHLLKRSRERRAALGLPTDGGEGTPAEGGAAEGSASVPAAVTPSSPAAAPAAAAPADGKKVFDGACAACHGAGIAGAPKFGDKAAWAPRIAQGVPTLEKHAIGGFQGGKGMMPAKGGRADLPDDAVRAAVEYMVSQAR